MKWDSDEEKEFKTKYVENYSSTHLQLSNIINKRLEELEIFFSTNKLTEGEYNKTKDFYLNRLNWVNDIEKDIHKDSIDAFSYLHLLGELFGVDKGLESLSKKDKH